MNREDFPTDEEGRVVSLETDYSIYGFFGRYRCLSNFHSCNVTHEGLTYRSSEAAYMAQKTLSIDLRKKFAECSTGSEAKKLGRSIELRKDWDEVHRIHSMYRVLLAKFTQDEHCLKVLLSTGDKYLEETNWWNDTYWGVCDGVGKNHLGQTLMTIRNFIRSV